MEKNFLDQFFGNNAYTHAFARDLIDAGRKDVLRELNKSIKLLGTGSGERIVHNLRHKHEIFADDQNKINTSLKRGRKKILLKRASTSLLKN